MGYQGGCHGLPDGGRLARYLQPSSSLRREAAGARVCGTRRGGVCASRGAPQPTGGRGCCGGSATAGGVGGKAIKKAQR